MKNFFSCTITSLIAAAILIGCGSPTPPEAGARPILPGMDDRVSTVIPDGPPPTLDSHDHGSHGPHGGELIEIGKASFHGELLLDENQVTLYVLDEHAKAPAPIGAPQVTVSLKHDGEVQTYELTANPETTDPQGTSSRFTLKDKQLFVSLSDGAEGVVIFQIDGKSYTGSFRHDHDHSGHDHSGHDHSGHDHSGHDH